ncbi:MAG TPA: FG-GAP-like repeat-containing protein, partial [Tepidisphaeraceae bacterium]
SAPSTVYDAGDDPHSPVIADVNNDNINDIVVSNSSHATVSVLLNDGDNHFNDRHTFTVGSGPGALVADDFNGDAKFDLAVCTSDNSLSVLLGNGNGTFQPQTSVPVGKDPEAIASADLNGDRLSDLVVANTRDDTVSVLLSKGDGTFLDQKVFFAGAAPISLALADVNRDGIPDIVTANSQADNVSVLIGKGNGTFNSPAAFAVSPHPSAVVVEDFNGDHKLDIASLSNLTANVSVLLGNGKGGFQSPTNFPANPGARFFMTGGDLGSALPALVTANEFDNTVGLMFTHGLPHAPTLVSPADGAKNLTAPELQWSGTNEFPSRVIVTANKADLPTDTNSRDNIPSAVIDTTTGSLASAIDISPQLLHGNTTYFWEVQIIQGAPGLFSPIRSFTTANRAPAINALPDAQVKVGTTYTAAGTFNDGDANDSWTGSVSYGDGSARSKLSIHGHRLTLSHVYKNTGKFHVSLKVIDASGATATDKLVVTVTKAAPASALSFANWTSTTAGKLGSFTFQVTHSATNSLFLGPEDLSTPSYSFAKGSAQQQVLSYDVNDSLSVTFNKPVPRLLLDTLGWRGSFSIAPPPTVSYTFNNPFTIRSGLEVATVNGDTLTLPSSAGFFDGIIEFDNVKTLSITTNATGGSSQGLTFAMIG